MTRKYLYLPFAVFILIVSVLFWQLARNAAGHDPRALASALIGKPLPALRLSTLDDPLKHYDRQTLLQGKSLLLNVWATWCPTCRAEHDYLKILAGQQVRIVGLNYRDDRQQALRWLAKLGDPYELNLYDEDGQQALDLGVYGAPETFLIDGKGIIRYRHVGAVTTEVWHKTLAPLWRRYQQEELP